MPNLYTLTTQGEDKSTLTFGERASVFYHSFFDFPLTISELIKWRCAESILDNSAPPVIVRSGYYFIEGGEGAIYKRILRKRISSKKIIIAKKASKLISLIPTIEMVAITGSLAMENASDQSDIDLLVVTKNGYLWTTRLFAYLLITLFGFSVRRPYDKDEKDKLCINMWLDESDLAWYKKGRNLYTAHEVAQIVPLINKNNIYEKFLTENKWILKYWPNAVKIKRYKDIEILNTKVANHSISSHFISSLVEKLAFRIQYHHMKSKITREVVTPTRALFHPQDWGKVVLSRLAS